MKKLWIPKSDVNKVNSGESLLNWSLEDPKKEDWVLIEVTEDTYKLLVESQNPERNIILG